MGVFYKEYIVSGPRAEVLAALRRTAVDRKWEIVEERFDRLFCLADPRRRVRPRKRVAVFVEESGLGTRLRLGVWGGQGWGDGARSDLHLLESVPYPSAAVGKARLRTSSGSPTLADRSGERPAWLRWRVVGAIALWACYLVWMVMWVLRDEGGGEGLWPWQSFVFLGVLMVGDTTQQFADEFFLRSAFGIGSRQDMARAFLFQVGWFVVVLVPLVWLSIQVGTT